MCSGFNYKAGLARLLHYTASDVHSTAWPSSTNFVPSPCCVCCTNASRCRQAWCHGRRCTLAQSKLCQHSCLSPAQHDLFQDVSDVVHPTTVKPQHYCAPTWTRFLLLAFALLDELEPMSRPARQAQPTSTQSSHPLRQGPGLTGNLTEGPVYEQHQQLPDQLLCLIPSVVICAGQQGQHCQAGPQRWHCTQLLARQQYCCPTVAVCTHRQL